jgi:arsenical pump membrane protein
MGSLAGLLWMELTRRAGLEVNTWDFIRVGVITTVPALVASLSVLWALSMVLP